MDYCTIEGCDKPILAKKLCISHYRKLRKYGDPLAGKIRHGLSGSREYSVWSTMLQRCNNPSNYGYATYGGRGIKVCDRWLKFTNFIEDMGPRPGDEYSIDRINNDGNYEPGNCHWTTQDVQQNNKRRRATLGVHKFWLPKKELRYRASLKVNGAYVLDKLFLTFEDALVARMRAELEHLSE